jgi:response regulator of citrate/malate metabolism
MLLPDGTGLDIISAVMSTPKPPQMVIVTAHPGHELVDEARRLVPSITVLEKPVRLEAMMELARTRVTR